MSSTDDSGDFVEDSSKEISGSSDESDEVISDSAETISNSSNEIRIPKRAHKQKLRNPLMSSEEEEEEEEDDEEEDERALSPRTRMSITGIRPSDLTDDSSSDDIDQGEEEEEEEKFHSTVIARNSLSGNDICIVEDEVEQEQEQEKVDPRPSSLTARRSASIYAQNNVDDSTAERTIIDDNKTNPLRYTEIFAGNISEKLSSTIIVTEENDNAESIHTAEASGTSSDADVKIISVKNETIEIFSSDEDAPEPPPKIIEAKTLQPKIEFAMPKPVVRSARKSKDTNEGPIQYVSAEFHTKEIKKLAEIKNDLESAERIFKPYSKALPDQGRQLKKRIESLQRDLEIKAKYLKIETNAQGIKEQAKKEQAALKVPDWNELSDAVKSVQPKYTGKQGLATFNAQRSMTIETLKGLHSSLERCPGEHVLAPEPTGLKVSLMPHQRRALAWMAWREKQKPHGGILADDMGLGKTLTTISMVLAAKQRAQEDTENAYSEEDDDDSKTKQGWVNKGVHKSYKGRTLVVCPASLIRQWEDEINNKLKRHLLSVCVHHGPNRETRAKRLLDYDFVITTYQLVSREHKSQAALFNVKWDRIILDEAHIVRNHKAASSLAVYSLQGKNRWALTGTPIQNKELDMYALLRFLRCKPFDDFATWKLWIETHTGGKERLHTILQTLMLRRTKALLQEAGALQCLPEKRTELISVELDKDEMAVYQKVLVISRSLFAQFLMQHAERQTEMGFKGINSLPTHMQNKDPNDHYYKLHKKFAKLHKLQEVKSAQILMLLLCLRQICCHPSLINAMLEEHDEQELKSDDKDDEKSMFNLLEQVNKLAIDEISGIDNLDGSEENVQLNTVEERIKALQE